MTKAGNDRIQGWLAVKEWLKVRKKRHEQTGELIEVSDLVIFNNCLTLIEYLPQIQHDDKNPNDCANDPHELTHICDALRYFCISRTQPTKVVNTIEKTFNFKIEEPLKADYGEKIVVV